MEKHLVDGKLQAGGSQWARGMERSPSAMIVPHDHVPCGDVPQIGYDMRD